MVPIEAGWWVAGTNVVRLIVILTIKMLNILALLMLARRWGMLLQGNVPLRLLLCLTEDV